MGLYYSFLAITGFAVLFDFGMVGTIGRNAAYAWGGALKFSAKGLPEAETDGQPNYQLLVSLTQITRQWYYILGLIIAMSLSTVGSYFLLRQIQQAGISENLIYCWLVFVAATAYGLSNGFWNHLLTGIGKVRESSLYGIYSQLASLLILVVGLLLGWRLWSYGISLLIAPVISRYLARKLFLNQLGNPMPSLWLKPHFETLRMLWPMTWRLGVVILGGFLVQRANTVISAEHLGLRETASYGLTLNLFLILFQIAGVPLYVATPRINQSFVQNDIPTIRKLFLTRAYGGLFLACIGGITIITLGSWGLQLIGSNTDILPLFPCILLFVLILLDQHQNYHLNLVLNTNENPFVFTSLATAIVLVSVSVMLTPRYGLAGMLIAHAFAQSLCNYWWPVLKGIRILRSKPQT